MDFLTPQAVTALFGVVGIDLVLAGDNAIVIGMAAAGLPRDKRAKAILLGIAAATVLRIGFAMAATELLLIAGLALAGGILLLWVCWKMWRELRAQAAELRAAEVLSHADLNHDGMQGGPVDPKKTLGQAAWQIVIADVSMSLDNVLAVAGAAREHPEVLIFGLALSIALMGLAAGFVAGLLQKYRWIGYLGLLIILYVALAMIWEGLHEVAPVVGAVGMG